MLRLPMLLLPEGGDAHRQAKESPKAKEPQPDEHGHQGNDGMQAQLGAHNFRLHIISDYSDDAVDQKQLQTQLGIPQYQRSHSPGNHDAAGTQDGQDVQQGNEGSLQHRAFNAEQGEKNAQFREGQQHDQHIGADDNEEGIRQIDPDIVENLLCLMGVLVPAKAAIRS